MDADSFWRSLGDGALVAAALTVVRLVLEAGLRRADRSLDREERTHRQQRDAEARLERLLHDRLADADRRLERSDLELQDERVRRATLEHEHARLRHAHQLLSEQYAVLIAEHARLAQQQRRPAAPRDRPVAAASRFGTEGVPTGAPRDH